MKCSGTSGPRCSAIHRVSASISASESLWPGMSSVVISNHTLGVVHAGTPGSPAPAPSCAGADPVVEVLGERLEVDVRGVDVRVELPPRLGADVAGGDRDRLDAPLAAGVGDVDGVLEEDRRVVVGERDAAAAARLGRQRERLRVPRRRRACRSPGTCRCPSSGRTCRPGCSPAVPKESTGGPGQEVVERLLLHRVDAEPARPAVGGQHDLVARTRPGRSRARVGPRAAGRPAGHTSHCTRPSSSGCQ